MGGKIEEKGIQREEREERKIKWEESGEGGEGKRRRYIRRGNTRSRICRTSVEQYIRKIGVLFQGKLKTTTQSK